MMSPSTPFMPSKVFLFTRTVDRDYHWFRSEPNRTHVELNARLLADQDANPDSPSTFLLFRSENEISIMVARLKTDRKDHSMTPIYNTLCLEFHTQDQSKVYSYAAWLLDNIHSEEIRKTLLLESEKVFNKGEGFLPELPPPPADSSRQIFPANSNHAYRSNTDNCLAVRQYLLNKSSTINGEHDSNTETRELVLSTGLINLDTLSNVINDNNVNCVVALSRSSSVSKTGTSLKKKQLILPLPIIKSKNLLIALLMMFVMLCLCILIFNQL